MTDLWKLPSCFFYSLLVTGLLLGGGARMGTAQSLDVPSADSTLQRVLSTVDSLRMAGEFQAAFIRLSSVSQEHLQSVNVLWRTAIVWSDYGRAEPSDDLALAAYRNALSMADRALKADSTSAWAHLCKAAAAGRAAPLVGSNKESIQLTRATKKHADRAIELDSTIASAYYIRGVWNKEVADLGLFQGIAVRAHGGLPEASFEQAVADLKQAIEKRPQTHHHLELGRTYMLMGTPEAAREQFQSTLDVPPVGPFALKDKVEARKHLDELD
ncbi:MAG: hypothetical protein R6T83_10185 [Salinibacter sp.]